MSLTASRRVPDLIVIGAIGVIAYFVSVRLNVFGDVLGLVRAHEGHGHWKLEDAFTLLVVLVLASSVYSLLRWRELSMAFREVRTLRGILPICAKCKKIRTDEGYWHSVDGYLREHTYAEFSHSLCPDRATELYPSVFGPEAEERRRRAGTGGADPG